MNLLAEKLIPLIVELRLALKATREPETAGRLRRVENELRELLAPGVPKAQAARVLGVSATALTRWVDRGRLPLVASSRSRA